jgi:hypothetical protein
VHLHISLCLSPKFIHPSLAISVRKAALRCGIKWPKRLEYILFNIKITYYKIKQFNTFESQSIMLLFMHLLCNFICTCNEFLIFKIEEVGVGARTNIGHLILHRRGWVQSWRYRDAGWWVLDVGCRMQHRIFFPHPSYPVISHVSRLAELISFSRISSLRYFFSCARTRGV